MNKFGITFLSIFIIVGAFLGLYYQAWPGRVAYKDNFQVIDELEISKEEVALDEQVLGVQTEPGMIYKVFEVNYPLAREDYYIGKFTNARAGNFEINKMPVVAPGSSVALIRDGFITLNRSYGYVYPPNGFYYASGICWSVSVLGGMLESVNAEFQRRWGMPLFNFIQASPHAGVYKTYQNSNNGGGYTIVKRGRGGVDFEFQVNPQVQHYPFFQDLKLEVLMISQDNHPDGYRGESIGAYLISNKRIWDVNPGM